MSPDRAQGEVRGPTGDARPPPVWYCPWGGVVLSVHGEVWYCLFMGRCGTVCPWGGVVLSVHGEVWYCLSMGRCGTVCPWGGVVAYCPSLGRLSMRRCGTVCP